MQVKDYAKRIETVDRDVAKLKETTATKKQLADLKVDFRKLYVRMLELKKKKKKRQYVKLIIA